MAYWPEIADYIRRYPKNEKVFKVIQRINSMKKEAKFLADKDTNSKKKKYVILDLVECI